MIQRILAALLWLFAAAAFAAVDVNKATQADLESIKGIGPVISTKILDERKKGPFKDWSDMIERVKGVGEHNAAKFSADGLTVNGSAYANAPATGKAAKTAGESKASKAADSKSEKAADTKSEKIADKKSGKAAANTTDKAEASTASAGERKTRRSRKSEDAASAPAKSASGTKK